MLRVSVCDLTTRFDLECDGPEVRSKAGASKLGVSLLEGPKLGEDPPALALGETRQDPALARRAERREQLVVRCLDHCLGIHTDRRVCRDGDHRQRVGMRRAEMDLRQLGHDLRLAVGGSREAPAPGRNVAPDGMRERQAQRHARRPCMIAQRDIPDPTDRRPVVAVEDAALADQRPSAACRHAPHEDVAKSCSERPPPCLAERRRQADAPRARCRPAARGRPGVANRHSGRTTAVQGKCPHCRASARHTRRAPAVAALAGADARRLRSSTRRSTVARPGAWGPVQASGAHLRVLNTSDQEMNGKVKLPIPIFTFKPFHADKHPHPA